MTEIQRLSIHPFTLKVNILFPDNRKVVTIDAY
jgi:hypothetical protein